MKYLDLSAASVEGDDADDVSAVGVSLEAAGGVGGVIEPQMILMESREWRFRNLNCHCGLTADHMGFNWSERDFQTIKKTHIMLKTAYLFKKNNIVW